MRFGNNEFDACLKRNASAASFRGASETSDRFRAIASRQRPRTVMLRSIPCGKTCVTNRPGPSGFLAAGALGGCSQGSGFIAGPLCPPPGPISRKAISLQSHFRKCESAGASPDFHVKACGPYVGRWGEALARDAADFTRTGARCARDWRRRTRWCRRAPCPRPRCRAGGSDRPTSCCRRSG